MSQNEELFGKDFFDAGRKDRGFCKSYSWNIIYPRFKALATQIKEKFNPATVLDVGCAKGVLVGAFRELGIDAYGVDISDYAISCAPLEIRPYLHRVDLNKDALPFENEKFDLVTCLEIVEYLHNYKLAIQEAHRILKPEGHLHLETSYIRNLEDKIRINIRGKSFWVREFQNNGKFKFMPRESVTFDRARLAYIFRTPQGKGTIKVRVGKLIWNKGGYLGKELAFLVGSKFSGTLLFTKAGK